MSGPTVITAHDGARAVVHEIGAQVASWIPAGGVEQFFTATNAPVGKGAYKGGVPICFPQFGGGALPQHGFARDQPWRLVSRGEDGDAAWAEFQLSSAGDVAARWPHAFALDLVVRVGGPRLEIALGIENTGPTPWSFTGALHTYFLVDDIRGTTLEGLGGRHYLDKTRGNEAAVQPDGALRLSSETDRVYLGAPSPLVLRYGTRTVEIGATGFPDVVVWNPWAGAETRWPQFAPGDFRRMICVEAAVAVTPVLLGRGERWRGSQVLILGDA